MRVPAAIDAGLLRVIPGVPTPRRAARSVSVRPRRLAFAGRTEKKSRVHECWRSPDTHPPTHALPPSASAGYSAAAGAWRIVLVNFCGNGRPELPRSACPRPRAARGTATVRRRAAVRGGGKHRTAATHVFHYTPRAVRASVTGTGPRYSRARQSQNTSRPTSVSLLTRSSRPP